MRLIDANALMEDICGSLNQMTNIGVSVDGEWLWGKLNDALEHAPTIEERKRGKWIPKSESGCIIECSMCGERMTVLGDENPNFCPNCGADMRGGQE